MKIAREIAEVVSNKVLDDMGEAYNAHMSSESIEAARPCLAKKLELIITAKLEPVLDWSEPSSPNEHCSYTHSIAETPFGRFLLTWKGWKESPDYGFDETPWDMAEYRGWSSVEEAQSWAGKEMARRIDALLSEEEKSP